MGYTTNFSGEFSIKPPLSPEQVAYLQAFSQTRRMKRDATKTEQRPDPLREAVKLPVGRDGEFFVGAGGEFGQESSSDILEYNNPPAGQPGLWCQWAVSDDGTKLFWDEGEKFYHYDDWLQYMIDMFFKPWGRTLDGDVYWDGEDLDDRGLLQVRDNVLTVKYGRMVYD